MATTEATTAAAASESSALPEAAPVPPEGAWHKLYGGAMRCYVCGGEFFDLSRVREVPDNQEVLHDAATDRVVIVELFELDKMVTDVCDAVRHYFDNLSSDNDSAPDSTSVESVWAVHPHQSVPHVAADVSSSVSTAMLLGTQLVAKGRESARNRLAVYMSLIRLPHVRTDMLITVSDPIAIDAGSSAVRTLDQAARDAAAPAILVIKTMLSTLRILDWSLFTPDSDDGAGSSATPAPSSPRGEASSRQDDSADESPLQ